MTDLLHDLRFALRSLARHPGFTAVAALTLALGIGANAAVFSVVDAVLLAPLPYPHPDELAIVWQNDRLRGTEREAASYPDLEDWRREAGSFAGLAGWRTQDVSLTGGDGEPERLTAAQVSAELFPLLGAGTGGVAQRFAAGRAFRDAEDRPGAEPVVVLSYGLWQRRFAADPGVVGRTLRLDGSAYTVIGVAGAGFDFPAGADLWLPLEPAVAATLEVRGVHNLLVLGRLAEGVTTAAAQDEMAVLMERLEREHVDDNQGRGAFVEPLSEAVTGDVRPALLLLFGAVLLVLLVASVNVANLVLTRAQGRGREMAVRGSLGAGRWRLARLLMVESLALALLGGAAGCLAVFWGVEALVTLAPADLPRLASVSVDARVLTFGFALSLVTGLLAGLAPLGTAFRRDLVAALKSGGASTADVRRRRVRQGLVVTEVALSVALAVGAGLLLRSLGVLLAEDPGFRPQQVLRLHLSLPEGAYPPPAWGDYPAWPRATQFYAEVMERTAALPGVTSAALAHNSPLDGGWTTRITLGDRPEPPPGERDEVVIRPVTEDYFRTVGVPLLAGRGFDERDRAGAADTVIVNHAFAERYFPGSDPVGVSLSFWSRPRTIVGVVGDVRFRGLGEETPPAMYPPLAQVPQGQLSLLVRTAVDASSLAPAVRQAVWEVDPDIALFGVDTLEQALADSLAQPRFRTWLLSLFAAVALLLAAVGLYGVMAALVAQRRREIGVRMALGAGRRQVLRAVLGRGMALTLAATALGLAAAFALARLLSSLLYGVSPADPLVFAAVPALLVAVALAACWLPARRAARTDPLAAMRCE